MPYELKLALIIGAVVILVAFIIILLVKVMFKRKGDADRGTAEKVRIKDGVRYTEHNKIANPDGSMKISHDEKDIILERGVTYTADKKSNILPGVYTVLSASGVDDSFNIRLNGFVREYKHGSQIILKEGESVCAVSGSVILR